jgi:hypothetical protein
MPFIAWVMGGKLDFSGMFLVLGTIPEGTEPNARRAQEGAGAGFRLRQLPHHPGEFHHPRLHHLRDDQAGQSPEAQRAGPCAGTGAGAAEEVLLLREIRDSLKK